MPSEPLPDPDLSEYFWTSGDLLSVFKAGGNFGLTNPAWQRILGWSPENLAERAFVEFVHPADVERTLSENVEQWDASRPVRTKFENRLRCRDGSYRWIEWSSQRRGDLIYSTGRDVTERNANMAELAAYVEMTQAIFSAAADLIVIVDRNLVISHNSPKGQTFFGYDDEVAMGASVFQLMHHEDRPRVEQKLRQMFEENADEIVTIRYRARHSDGHWMVIESRGHTLKGADGSATQAVFIARDLTDSLAAEAELAESRETTRAILDAAIDSIIVIDRDLTILEASPGTESLHGVAPQDRVGRKVYEMVVAQNRDMVRDAFNTAFETDGAVSFRTQMHHVDGHLVTIDLRGRTLRDSDRPPTRLVFIARDISASAASELALAGSFAKTKAILDAAPDSILVIDRDLMVVEASPGTERTYGVPKSERMGRSAMSIVHPEDAPAVKEQLERMFANESDELMSYRFRALHADGHWMIIETRGRLLNDEEGQPLRAVLVSRDVTEAVAFEGTLAAAKEEAERANAAKSEFMSRMSHELRTPLNSVLGFAQILQMELESKEDLELVDHVYKSGQHLLTLINEVLDISRVESGNIGLSLQSVRLRDLVDECLDIIGPQAKERGVGINCTDSYDYSVTADQLRLKQVILNLLSNAIKFNRPHGSVTLNFGVKSNNVRFSVADTGFGIAPELRERLFTAFDRLDAETRGIEGTGLGLMLSKTLIEAMGGTLGFETTVDEGSTFWFELPLAKNSSAASLG
jgi:PAS domain S-box-containing protein